MHKTSLVSGSEGRLSFDGSLFATAERSRKNYALRIFVDLICFILEG